MAVQKQRHNRPQLPIGARLRDAISALAAAIDYAAAIVWTGNHEWSGTAPYTQHYETDGTANKRRWRWTADSGKYTLTYRTDAGALATAGEVMSVDPAPTALIGEQTFLRFGGTTSGVRVHALGFSAGSDPADPVFALDPNSGVGAYLGLGIYAWAESYALQTNYIGLAHDGTDGTIPSSTSVSLLPTNGIVKFNASQATEFRIENRTSDPGSPAAGQIWLRTDL